MSNVLSFTAVGDCFITRHIADRSEAFQQIVSIIKKGEARFMNLEVTVRNGEGYPAAISGGTWATTVPQVLNDIRDYGFNLVAWANNHTLDYLHDGLLATEKYLNEFGFVHAGAGRNLALASAPKYLDCPSGRVALIAATSGANIYSIAGEQRRDTYGRPGINPVRFTTSCFLSESKFLQIRELASQTGLYPKDKLIKAKNQNNTAENNSLMFGGCYFEVGSPEGITTDPIEKDCIRIANSIKEAKRQADYVIFSIHAHEAKNIDKYQPADYLQSLAKKCIDAGADAVIGHGPHVVRGIEIYNNRPIFYSLGNFIFQNATVSEIPYDMYDMYGLGHENNVADVIDLLSATKGKELNTDPLTWCAVIPYWTVENGKIKELLLYPIELGFESPRYRRGCPKVTKDTAILERLKTLSEPFGTKIEICDSVGRVIV